MDPESPTYWPVEKMPREFRSSDADSRVSRRRKGKDKRNFPSQADFPVPLSCEICDSRQTRIERYRAEKAKIMLPLQMDLKESTSFQLQISPYRL
jgi:hypothetical protein